MKNVQSKVLKTASVFNSNFIVDESLKFYVKRISKFKVLTPDEEKELARLSGFGDEEAKKINPGKFKACN